MNRGSDYTQKGPRGLLTEHDRQYLARTVEYEDSNSEAQKRYKIRRQIINGIIDFSAVQSLSTDDLELIFGRYDRDDAEGHRFRSGLISALNLFYYYLGRERFEYLVKQQIRRDIQTRIADDDEFAPVDVEISVNVGESIPIEEKIDRVAEGEEVTQGFLDVLSYTGRLRNHPDVQKMKEEHPELWEADSLSL
jgi:hypothetical protein